MKFCSEFNKLFYGSKKQEKMQSKHLKTENYNFIPKEYLWKYVHSGRHSIDTPCCNEWSNGMCLFMSEVRRSLGN